MPKKFDPQHKDLLLAPEREKALKPKELLKSFGLKSGDTIADIGCGPGFFTLPAAAIVGPTGKVYALDVQSDMAATVTMRVADLGLHHVEVMTTEETEVPLPSKSVQMVWMAFVLHEMEKRAMYLHRLRPCLRAGGRVVVLEWLPEAVPETVQVNEPLAPEDIRDDARSAGFEVVEQRQVTPQQYAMVLVPL
jgi:ubiquinone/menaquinone biosynthesis C-methylase UbiE